MKLSTLTTLKLKSPAQKQHFSSEVRTKIVVLGPFLFFDHSDLSEDTKMILTKMVNLSKSKDILDLNIL